MTMSIYYEVEEKRFKEEAMRMESEKNRFLKEAEQRIAKQIFDDLDKYRNAYAWWVLDTNEQKEVKKKYRGKINGKN